MFTRTPTTRAAAAVLVALALTVSACDSNEPENGGAGDEELITQVRITMTNAADASDAVTITATASNGRVIDTFSPARATLRPGVTYDATVELDDTINNVSITDEIGEEAEEHRFQYAVTPASAATVTVTDRESDYVDDGADENGAGDLPVGLRFRVAVASGASGDGTLNATLFHFEDVRGKNSATATSDERDIDVNFPVSFSAPTARR